MQIKLFEKIKFKKTNPYISIRTPQDKQNKTKHNSNKKNADVFPKKPAIIRIINYSYLFYKPNTNNLFNSFNQYLFNLKPIFTHLPKSLIYLIPSSGITLIYVYVFERHCKITITSFIIQIIKIKCKLNIK